MANTNVITIAELEEIQSAPDSSFIPIDDGSVTNKISIENFTASSNQTAEAQALKSEGYADGKQDGVDVEEGSPYYHNNAKYYSDQASATKTTVENYVELAQTAQETATQKASDASSAESFAEAFAGDARSYAQAADGHAIDASNYATVASSAATTATNAKTSALNAASDAQSAKLDAISAKDDAETAATSSSVDALKSEGYAIGKQNGADVTSGSPYYNNNAKYYYRQALSKANLAEYLSQVSEGYAKGTMDGSPCQHDEPGYNDNSKYYKDLAATSASQAEAWSSNPPYIGANGNWYVYDIETSAYADSGIDASISVTVGTTSTLAPGSSATVTNSGTDISPVLNFGIPQGAKGDIGITPDITVSATADATSSATPTVNVTKGGTTTAPTFALAFSGLKGTKGDTGNTGDDGVSPEVTISTITGGHTVTITDADHPSGQSFNVMDGEDGDDGVSPAVSTSIITGGHTVTITDKDHPSGQSFNVMDGQNGQDGDDGVSPEVTITTISGGHTVTITDADHPSGQSFNVMDGAGAGDMLASTYDPASAVATAGGIPAYVAANQQDISGKMDKANPTGTGSLAVGDTVTMTGTYAQAMGSNVKSSGLCSHAEGKYTTASGSGSHAEGYGLNATYQVKATGNGSHAEGYVAGSTTKVTASGTGSHAEGSGTTASGNYSHAGGYCNTAAYDAQTAIGKYNSNKSTTYFEVGNGTGSSAQSNAFEVYSDGSLSTNNGTTKTKLPSIISATLAANATQVVISGLPSSGNNLIDFYTSVPGLDYSAISVSGTSATLTYEAQSTATTVYAVITEVTS